MITRKELKSTAKQVLKREPFLWTKFGLLFISFLIVYKLATSLLLYIPYIGVVFYLIISLIGNALIVILPIKKSLELLLSKETNDYELSLKNSLLIYVTGKIILLSFVMSFFIFCWSLLFVIPGIIKGCSYAMAPYILIDDPSVGILEAITKSRHLMDGYKMDYFVLQLSYLGWGILTVLSFFVGYIWYFPYVQVTNAAFYLHLKNSAG